MPVIDVHTHMFTTRWLELLRANGGIYNIKTRPDGQREIFRGDTPVVRGQPILHLVAIPTAGRHYLAARLSGLAENRTHRVTAWVRKPFEMGEVLDVLAVHLTPRLSAVSATA